MKSVNAIVMNYNEFDELIGRVSNGEAGVGNESGDWFYVTTENYNEDDINKDLSDYLHVNVVSVLVDLTQDKDNVVVICQQIWIFISNYRYIKVYKGYFR